MSIRASKCFLLVWVIRTGGASPSAARGRGPRGALDPAGAIARGLGRPRSERRRRRQVEYAALDAQCLVRVAEAVGPPGPRAASALCQGPFEPSTHGRSATRARTHSRTTGRRESRSFSRPAHAVQA